MATSNTKRPRLSLQIKTVPRTNIRPTKNQIANSDPKSPTAFNTLSNVYVTAIERSTPIQSTPLTAINLSQPLRLQTNHDSTTEGKQRKDTPYTAFPDTPLSANPASPMQIEMTFPSTMAATPPLSAGPVEPGSNKFSFTPSDKPGQVTMSSPVQTRRVVSYGPQGQPLRAPYTHPRTLHSILRNSPLPPSSAKSPVSPRRQSLRLQEKAARRVGYESPLTQTITTEKYTKSHIDLLVEEASPYSASPISEDSEMVLDLAMAYSGDETRDGGETPGPLADMRRRMAGLGTETPVSSPRPGGIRKRRKEKKRKWVWTIGQDEEEDEGGAMAAIRAATTGADSTADSTPRTAVPRISLPKSRAVSTPTVTPESSVKISVEPADSETGTTGMDLDVEMSDTSSAFSSSRATTPFNADWDAKTPTVTTAGHVAVVKNEERLRSGDNTGKRRDTPIPGDLIGT